MEQFLNGKVSLYRGDCLEVLPTLEDNSVDACVCDPPYHLTQGKKGGSGVASINLDSPYGRSRIGTGNGAGGFMGQKWDGGDIAFRPEVWMEVLRVLKPGGHLLAFSGTRTYHRMACAIEDAGFEIRDQIGWAFGQGFPKSHNIGNGLGTALKPAWEPICLARKPISESSIAANVLKHGTGAINVDGCRVGTEEITTWATKNGNSCFGQVVKTGADKCPTTSRSGRWPANLIHDGSEEVLEGFPESVSVSGGTSSCGDNNAWSSRKGLYTPGRVVPRVGHDDSGSAARFFYTAKADVDDRLGSKHPTVKPIDLMQYLVRLITPKGGIVLDPFAGSGTCAEAAYYEGMRAILIEREPEYQADIVKRMGLVLSGPDSRRGASIKQESLDDTPLFGRLER